MRIIIVGLLFLLQSFILSSQHQEIAPGSARDVGIPQWAQLMYAQDADPGLVVDAYVEYYRTNVFVKNGHTQYYKHWLRNISRDINGLQFSFDKNIDRAAILANEAQFIANTQMLAQAESPTSEWQCIGPIDYDHDAIERSYAPGHAHIYVTRQAPSDHNILYAGTATAGLWKSTDYGINWTLMTSDLMVNGIRSLEIDYSDANTMYFGGAGKIYKTTNGGTSWSTTGDATFNSSDHSTNDLKMHPSNSQILFACLGDGFYRSSDAGTNWTKVLGGEFQEVEIHPTNPDIVYSVKKVGDHTEFFKSTDNGLTFSIKPTGWPGLGGSSTATFGATELGSTANNYATFATNPSLGGATTPDFTIELRVKSDGWSSDPAIISNKDWASGNNSGFIIAGRTNGSGWLFNIGDGSNRIDLNGNDINDGLWHHIAITYDADGTKAIYQDGTLVGSSTVNLTTEVVTALDLALAQDGTLNYGTTFPGEISDVRIWNAVLSESVINDNRCEIVDNTHPNYANLLHYWKIDEASGNTLTDDIGTNNATIGGTASWSTNQNLTCLSIDLASGEHQRRTEIAVSAASPNIIYAQCPGVANGGDGLYGIYKSTDAGESWTFECCGTEPGGIASTTNTNVMGYNSSGASNGGQIYYDVSLDVSDIDANELHLGGVMHWISTNGGQTWTCPAGWSSPGNNAYVHADIHDVEYMSNGDLMISSDGGLYYSSDGGNSFSTRSKGIEGTDFWGFGAGFKDGDVMVGGTYHNSVLVKDGNTYNNGWISTAIGGNGGDNYRGFVNPGKEREIYMDGGRRVLSGDRTQYSSNLSYLNQPNATYTTGASSDLVFHPNNYNKVYSGTGTGLYVTEDDGETSTLLYDFGEDLASFDISWVNPDYIFVSTFAGWWDQKNLYRSTDGGQSFTQLSLPFSGSTWVPLDITCSSNDANTLWVTRTSMYSSTQLNGALVYKSTDGGNTWVNWTTSTLDGETPSCIVHQRGTDGGVYLGTRRAVYYRNNTMTDWALFNNNLPVATSAVRLIPYYKGGKLRNGTQRSVYEVDFYETSSPQAVIAAEKFESFCTRDEIQFIDHSVLSDNGASWSWSFEGGIPATSSDREPLVAYNAPGTYDVTLTVTDAFGTNTSTLSDYITVTAECEPEAVPGYALSLGGGSTDYAVAEPLNITTNTITLTGWVKRSGNQAGYAGLIFSRGNGAKGLNLGDNNELRYHWESASNYNWDSGLVLPDNEWTHVALVIEPTQATIYMNGKASVRSLAHSAQVFDAALAFGADSNFSGRRFNGLMDEICVYDRALSQDEIRALRHLTKVPSDDTSLIHYWQFNRADGVATDRVATSHAGIGTGTRVTSTGPFGGGVSHKIDVSTGGVYDFTDTGLSLTFPNTGTYPDGDLVVSRIDLSPDQVPTNFPTSAAYWVVNNYGNNSAFSALTSLDFSNVGTVSTTAVNDPASVKLYKRNSNLDGTTWGNAIDEGESAVAGANGAVSFSTDNGVTGFSQFIVSFESTALPVELLDFNVHLNDRDEVDIKWSTLTETNSDYFEVEKSKDSFNFDPIEKVDAAGNSSELINYTALDEQPWRGQNYYRIKQVDTNGDISYSETKSILFNALASDIVAFPNPIQQGNELNILSNLSEALDVNIYDAKGRLVKIAKLENGEGIIVLDNLPSGTYFYRITGVSTMKRGVLIVVE